jgi:outer membrane immunogenic protein
VGGGIEWAFAGNWTVRGEYTFISLENHPTCGVVAAIPYCWNHDGLDGVSTAKIGFNYLFTAGPAPFVP